MNDSYMWDESTFVTYSKPFTVTHQSAAPPEIIHERWVLPGPSSFLGWTRVEVEVVAPEYEWPAALDLLSGTTINTTDLMFYNSTSSSVTNP